MELPAWFSQLEKFDNPIRREFHLLCLLSGSRPGALSEARIEHLDLRRRVLHLPRPKGGAERAFDIPLSRPMVRSLVRAIRAGRLLHPDAATEWLFPAASASGHLEEHKEGRDVLAKWGNDLRQSYRTLAHAAGVSEVDAKLLMNHKLPGVNAGYLTKGALLGHLRAEQARISAFILSAAGAVLIAGEVSRSQFRRILLDVHNCHAPAFSGFTVLPVFNRLNNASECPDLPIQTATGDRDPRAFG